MNNAGSRLYFLPLLLLCFACFLHPCAGQFYAPDTEHHDPVQRMYVVEAARVLAWWQNLDSTNPICEIRYQVSTRADKSTAWDIEWLDKSGKTIKETSLLYPDTLLKQGPEFYRSIFKKIGETVWARVPGLSSESARKGYWQGAGKVQPSREESLRAAFAFTQQATHKNFEEWAPQLAGLLPHAALPSTTSQLSLDSVLTARGAAWLAFVEVAATRQLDELWSPVLLLAHREQSASRLWQQHYSASAPNLDTIQTGWNILLRKPTTHDIYYYAVDHDNLAMSLPMLIRDMRVDATQQLLINTLPLLAKNQKTFAKLHNYAPFLAVHGTIAGGHYTQSAPDENRQAWLGTLAGFTPGAGDYTGYQGLLSKTMAEVAKAGLIDKMDDPSLPGLEECVPLLQLSHKEGTGSLSPTAVVSARDLLNYGWEMAGLQMSARWIFVNSLWGVPETGEKILRTTTKVDGWMPFLMSAQRANTANYGESQMRLQLVSGLREYIGYTPPPFTDVGQNSAGADLYVKRCWLSPLDFDWQARSLWDANLKEKDHPEITSLIKSYQEEGDGLNIVNPLHYLTSLNKKALSQIPQGAELKHSLAESLPQPTGLYIQAVYSEKYQGLSDFVEGQTHEKTYWLYPDSLSPYRVFRCYVVSGGFPSARRFYRQCRENITDTVEFSNAFGPVAWVVGYCAGDQAMRSMALEDSRSGSASDMMINAWEAAAKDDSKQLLAVANEMRERYEGYRMESGLGTRLMNFIPLLPALKNRAHPDHGKALDYWGKGDTALILRWIWIEQYKLSKDDAIRLLGGQENDLARRVLISYLDGNVLQASEAMNRFINGKKASETTIALVTYQFVKMHPLEETRDVDLKPAGTESVYKAIIRKLKEREKRKSA